MTDLKAIEEQRGTHYGPPRPNHRDIGQAWGAALTAAEWKSGDNVPPDVVAGMMAMLKIVRG